MWKMSLKPAVWTKPWSLESWWKAEQTELTEGEDHQTVRRTTRRQGGARADWQKQSLRDNRRDIGRCQSSSSLFRSAESDCHDPFPLRWLSYDATLRWLACPAEEWWLLVFFQHRPRFFPGSFWASEVGEDTERWSRDISVPVGREVLVSFSANCNVM